MLQNLKGKISVENKNLVKNTGIVVGNNIITLSKSIILSIGIPKLLSVDDYAIYKIFTLYLSYAGFFHYGFIDGVGVKYGGNITELNSGKSIRLFTRVLLAIELITCIGLWCLGLFLNNSLERGLICLVGVYIVFHNMNAYFQLLFQLAMKFKTYTYSMSFFNIINLVLFFLLFFYKWGNGYMCVGILIISEMIVFLINLFLYPTAFWGKAEPFRKNVGLVKEIFAKGLPLMLAGIVMTLILNLDRQFVLKFFTKYQYAQYAFAYSLVSLISTFVSALSLVLYPMLKKSGIDVLQKMYLNMTFAIAVIIYGFFILIPVLRLFMRWFLPNYVEAVEIFEFIYPSLVCVSIIKVVIANYFKTLENTKLYFTISLIAFGISFGANILAYLLSENMLAIAIATTCTCIIWYYMCDIQLRRIFSLNHKLIYYIAFMSLICYAMLFMKMYVNNWWAIAFYVGLFSLTTYIYYKKCKVVYL